MVLQDLFPDSQKSYPETINGKTLRRMFLSSLEILKLHYELLNNVNVFPVPDGDTGINMLQTFQTIVKEIINLKHEDSCGVIISSAAKGAFIGCVGNSGIILSEYIRGLEEAWQDSEQINKDLLVQGLILASRYAYQALERPREGTILTIGRKIAETATELANQEKKLYEILFLIFERAKIALFDTHHILPEANIAGVIDAGALGLVLIFEGFIEAFFGTKTIKLESLSTINEDLMPYLVPKINFFNLDSEYELICYIGELKKSLDYIREELTKEGDCLLIVSADLLNDIKIHIHCPDPERVISKLRNYVGYLDIVSTTALHTQSREFSERNNLVDKGV